MEPCQVQTHGNQKKGLLELCKEVKPNAPWDDVLPHTLDDNVLPLVVVDLFTDKPSKSVRTALEVSIDCTLMCH